MSSQQFTSNYQEVFALREEEDAPKRGYRFEQLIREILPWSYRPPIAVKSKHEQLDAFFEWKGWHFLVEAKAKEKPISPGSHDWEDFCLKIKNRRGQCIGLFCSLFDVSDSVFAEAYMLNRDGCTTIVISGKMWDELAQANLSLSDFLQYMVSFARSTFQARPHSIKEVKEYCHNVDEVIKDIRSTSNSISSTFLRRHKLIRHEDVYVARIIDAEVLNLSRLLRPSSLSIVSKKKSHKKKDYIQHRQCPTQAFLVKDFSGSGKTTLSVQIALEAESFFGIAKAALQSDIDGLPDYLSRIGKDYGLKELSIVNKPIVYVVDSLDEAVGLPNKQREVGSLFRFLDELNSLATSCGYVGFPILIGFTVRDDFWREWESVFEGRKIAVFNKRFSYFSPIELSDAIKFYSMAYHYKLEKGLDAESKRVLSHPFNLQIFSEANEYKGAIPVANILDENVLSLFFERKKEDITRRPIPGFTGYMMMRICAQVAKLVAHSARNSFSLQDVREIIRDSEPILKSYMDQIANLLVSEQIIVRDPEDTSKLRFRHMRFIEYLVAYYIAYRLNEQRRPELLEDLTDKIFSTEFVSIYYVHEFIRHICRAEFAEIYQLLTSYYSKSSTYIKKLLSLQTSNIAYGMRTSSLELDTILKSMEGSDSEICWQGFFVVSAKNNNQPKERILQAFDIAWKTNFENRERWKLLYKIVSHGLELEETVILKILQSEEPKEWYILLEGIYEHGYRTEFQDAWRQLRGSKIQQMLLKRPSKEWTRVNKIINIVLSGRKYDPTVIE